MSGLLVHAVAESWLLAMQGSFPRTTSRCLGPASVPTCQEHAAVRRHVPKNCAGMLAQRQAHLHQSSCFRQHYIRGLANYQTIALFVGTFSSFWHAANSKKTFKKCPPAEFTIIQHDNMPPAHSRKTSNNQTHSTLISDSGTINHPSTQSEARNLRESD